MLVAVRTATNLQLDWMVAKAENLLGEVTQARTWAELSKERGGIAFTHGRTYSPTTNWNQGGPIIEREGIPSYTVHSAYGLMWKAAGHFGPTWLVACLRSHIVNKLGGEVEVPDGLV